MKKTIKYESLVNEILGAVDAASNTFQAVGKDVDGLCAGVADAVGTIKTAGNNVDKSLKILMPVILISNSLFAGEQGSALFKSLKGSRSSSTAEIEFIDRDRAERFAATVPLHKELKAYCTVKSVQVNKVVLSVNTDYLEKNFNQFQRIVDKLQTTTAKRAVGEGIGAALIGGIATTAGSMMVKPLINKIQGKSGENMQVNYQFKDSGSMNKFVKFIKSPEIAKATAKVASEDNVNKVVTIQGDEKKLNTVFQNIEKKAAELGAVGGDAGNDNSAGVAVNENWLMDKVSDFVNDDDGDKDITDKIEDVAGDFNDSRKEAETYSKKYDIDENALNENSDSWDDDEDDDDDAPVASQKSDGFEESIYDFLDSDMIINKYVTDPPWCDEDESSFLEYVASEKGLEDKFKAGKFKTTWQEYRALLYNWLRINKPDFTYLGQKVLKERKENTKMTLTIGQLKKIISESVDEDKVVRVTAIDWDVSNLANWDDDQPLEIDDDDEEHWDDDQIDDDEMTDDEKNELFKKLGLPTMDEVIEVPVPADWTLESDDGEVADWLSDEYDFCVNSWMPADEVDDEDTVQVDEGWSDDPANDPEDGDWEMNPDGTFKRDANGKKIPKSFRKDIKNFWNKLRGRA